jgi:hypothetical protein
MAARRVHSSPAATAVGAEQPGGYKVFGMVDSGGDRRQRGLPLLAGCERGAAAAAARLTGESDVTRCQLTAGGAERGSVAQRREQIEHLFVIVVELAARQPVMPTVTSTARANSGVSGLVFD